MAPTRWQRTHRRSPPPPWQPAHEAGSSRAARPWRLASARAHHRGRAACTLPGRARAALSGPLVSLISRFERKLSELRAANPAPISLPRVLSTHRRRPSLGLAHGNPVRVRSCPAAVLVGMPLHWGSGSGAPCSPCRAARGADPQVCARKRPGPRAARRRGYQRSRGDRTRPSARRGHSCSERRCASASPPTRAGVGPGEVAAMGQQSATELRGRVGGNVTQTGRACASQRTGRGPLRRST
jgi:hypothetical protein